MSACALDAVSSLKVKLGLLVAASVVTAVLLTLLGSAADVSPLLVLPVSVALALGVTQLLAAGMVAPLRRMTEVLAGDGARRLLRPGAHLGHRRGRPARRRLQPDGRGPRDGRPRAARPDRHRLPRAAYAAHGDDRPAREPRRRRRARRLRAPRRRARGGPAAGPPGRRPAPALPARGGRGRAGPPATSRCARWSRTSSPRCARAGRTPALRRWTSPDDLVVAGDPARLRQLLVNVLDNAARHAPAGTPSASRGSTARRPGDGALVARGRRRRRGSGARGPRAGLRALRHRRRRGGTGLGLAVARWVAQLHGGTLRFLDPRGRAAARGCGSRSRAERATAVLASPTPVPSAVPPSTASARRQPTVAADTTRARSPGWTPLFGRFWPERAAPHGLRTVVAAAGAGLVAGIALSFTAIGITWTLVAHRVRRRRAG